MRTAFCSGVIMSALALSACGNVDLTDANSGTEPLWVVNNGTASLVMREQSDSGSQATLRIDNHHLSYSITYDENLAHEAPSGLDWNFSDHEQGAIDSILEYSDARRGK